MALMKFDADAIVARLTPADIIEQLTPLIRPARQQRIDDVLAGRVQSIHLALEQTADINNALATIRTSEALGVTDIHLIAPEGSAGSVKRVTQGAIYWVNVHIHPTLDAFLAWKPANMLLAGGALHSNTPPCPVQALPVDQPLCLLLGNEQRGLTEAAMDACDLLYQVPMFGMSESLNLSVSAAISLYDILQRKRQLIGSNSDLSANAHAELQAKYYLNSVSPRLVKILFPLDTTV